MKFTCLKCSEKSEHNSLDGDYYCDCGASYFFDEGKLMECDFEIIYNNQVYFALIGVYSPFQEFSLYKEDIFLDMLIMHLDYLPQNVLTDFNNVVEKYLKLMVFV